MEKTIDCEKNAKRLTKLVEARLASYFDKRSDVSLYEAMRYSVAAGGKRIRPLLTLTFCSAVGGGEDGVLDAACAVELLHTYSLIHDDLPCMDDGDERRGQPSNHKRFGEWKAVLAGDALQALAFEKLLGSGLPAGIAVRAGRILAEAAGPAGICGGQTLDMELESNNNPELQDLYRLHHMKTASLIEAACLIGAVAGGASPERERAARIYAQCVGLAFQIRDDLLDRYGSAAPLGKASGADARNNKATFASVLPREECEKFIAEQTYTARETVRGVFDDGGMLTYIANTLANRQN
ncbi:MAG: polyprenyl synthetase family protein [Oscillospiraceae bacterium]|nr:polyprenyl synthetase family protein [Oscillospiraceae bacterium]